MAQTLQNWTQTNIPECKTILLHSLLKVSFATTANMMGQGQKYLTRVGSGQVNFFVAWVGQGWVSYLWFGIRNGKFPLKIPNCQLFSIRSKSTWVKNGSASYLQRVKSMLMSGQGPAISSVPINVPVSLFHTRPTSTKFCTDLYTNGRFLSS